MVKLHALQIRQQLLEPRLALAGKAGHHGRTDRHIRDDLAQHLRRAARLLNRPLAVHLLQNRRDRMLNRHVDVTDRMLRRTHPDHEIFGDFAWIAVQHPHPEIPFDSIQRP